MRTNTRHPQATAPRRVVVTGLGAITPCGLDAPSSWQAAVDGRSGIGPITKFDTTGWAVRIAGEVLGFDPTELSRADKKRMDTFTQYGVVASLEAVRDAGLDLDGGLGERAGVYVGTGIGGVPEIARMALTLENEGIKRVSPFFIPRSLTNLAAGHVAMRLGAQGPSLCISTACATGNHSIGEAWRVLRSGEADVVVAGGTESAIIPLGHGGFMVMRALSKRNDDPQTASRPFDIDRDGFVMGEGAGILVLEELEHARARGARIYCELLGYALNNDAHHMTAPPPGHAGAVRCMKAALRAARIEPSEVDYVNAHGTSTPANDENEVAAIKTVFGDHAQRLLVSSTKSVTGHLLGAAGGVEALFCARALHEGVAPPTATLQTPDPTFGLDFVQGEARQAPLDVAVSNAFGFGGTNATLVFGRFTG